MQILRMRAKVTWARGSQGNQISEKAFVNTNVPVLNHTTPAGGTV
jgi:hypothetical protein